MRFSHGLINNFISHTHYAYGLNGRDRPILIKSKGLYTIRTSNGGLTLNTPYSSSSPSSKPQKERESSRERESLETSASLSSSSLMAAASASSSSPSPSSPQGVAERRGIPAASFVEDVETYLKQSGLDVNSSLAFLQERLRFHPPPSRVSDSFVFDPYYQGVCYDRAV